MIRIAILLAGAIWSPGHHPFHVAIYDHGHKLLRMYDPSPDGCTQQWSYVRSRRDRRIVAQEVRCWGFEVDNYTRHRLVIHWRTS